MTKNIQKKFKALPRASYPLRKSDAGWQSNQDKSLKNKLPMSFKEER